MKKIILLLFLGISLLLVSCTQNYTKEGVNILENKARLEGYEDGLKEGQKIAEPNWIKKEDIALESSYWCYLIISPNGDRPHLKEDVMPIRTWHLSSDEISQAEFKYWITCDTKYR